MTQLCNLTSQELNNVTFNKFLNSYLFSHWKNHNGENPSSGSWRLEIIFSPKCNLKCEYCYVNRNNENIYFNTPWDTDLVIKNTKLLLNWLYENDFNPELDIFSGELFAQESGFQLLETILEFYQIHNDKSHPPAIIIPTNGTFLKDEKLSNRVHNLVQEFKKLDINIHLSFSFDGFYADAITRKYKCNLDYELDQPLDQDYYDTLFTFMKDHDFLSHPMVSPENVHVWKQNYLWFMDMYEKYGLSPRTMYLLEVRNNNWDKKSVQDLSEFLNFIMDYWWEKTNHNSKEFLQYLLEADGNKGISAGNNILVNNLFGPQRNSGPSCTLGSHLMIRVSDLTIFPCHRLLYPELDIAHFEETEDGKLNLICDNIELGICTFSFSPYDLPVCSTCAIRGLCCTPCYGSQYETNKELFTPIPTVCCMEYAKIKTILEKIIDFGIYYEFLDQLEQKYRINIHNFVQNELKEKMR